MGAVEDSMKYYEEHIKKNSTSPYWTKYDQEEILEEMRIMYQYLDELPFDLFNRIEGALDDAKEWFRVEYPNK